MKRALIFICLLLTTPFAIAQQATDTLILAQKLTLHSDVLKEDRTFWVSLPPSYELKATASRKYPVVYLLDGRAHLNALTGVLHHLSANSSAVERIPEMIVVALPNTNRTRDFTPTHIASGLYSKDSGGAADFLRFMKDELIPHIESRYRASSERTVVGHSLGGLLALNAFIAQPDLFTNTIAIDPSLSWGDAVLVKRLRQQPVAKTAAPVSVFIAMANSPVDPSYPAVKAEHENAIREFESILDARQSASLRVQHRYFEDETHLSVPLIAIYRGLIFAYDGYKKPQGN